MSHLLRGPSQSPGGKLITLDLPILVEGQGAVLTGTATSPRSKTASPAHGASVTSLSMDLKCLLHHHRIPKKLISDQTGDVPLVRHPPLGGAREAGLGC